MRYDLKNTSGPQNTKFSGGWKGGILPITCELYNIIKCNNLFIYHF